MQNLLKGQRVLKDLQDPALPVSVLYFVRPFHGDLLEHWWAWYHGMAQFASIFAFLVFLLWCWLTMMQSTNMMPYMSCMSLHDHLHSKLDFSLSLYCLQCLYLVTPRRWKNDLWLGWSLGWLDNAYCALHNKCLSHLTLSKASLVLHPLSFFFICILYFVIYFWTVSQMFPAHPGAGPTGYRTCHTAQHTSQVTCHSWTLAICFILFLHM